MCWMRFALIALTFFLASGARADDEDWNAWRKDTKKFVEGRFKYYVHTPPGFDARESKDKKYPLLVVAHWSYVDGPAYLHYWRPDADAHGVIVAAPNSIGGANWIPADGANVEHMVTQIKAQYPIDDKQVWLAGYSAGGVFIYYELFKYPSLFTAVLPVGGRIRRHKALVPTDQVPRTTRVCVFHGKTDRNIHFSEAESDIAILRSVGYEVELHAMPKFGHWIPRDRGAEMFACLRGKPPISLDISDPIHGK